MITALDSNVLLDVLMDDDRFGEYSLEAIERAATAGSLVICDLVYTEISAHFSNQHALDQFLHENSIGVQSLDRSALYRAGRTWKAYRKEGGTRARILADFLIGAHAEAQCSALISRDRGFYRARYPTLKLIDPSADA